MDQLREKIQELKDRFNSSLSGMLETEEEHVYRLSMRIGRMQQKLSELSGEVERVIRESFRNPK